MAEQLPPPAERKPGPARTGQRVGDLRRTDGRRVVDDAKRRDVHVVYGLPGLCQPPSTRSSADGGPDDPGSYSSTGGGLSRTGVTTRQASITASARANSVW